MYNSLDFLKAFNQIENTSKAKERLVIAIRHRNYKYLIMPFRPADAPCTFAKAIYMAFGELVNIIASYIDHITVYSKHLNYCLSYLRWTFESIILL